MSLELHIPDRSVVRRLPRTLNESASVFPDWRYQQAAIYDHAARANGSYALLTQEEDQLVLQLYAFLRHGTSGDSEVDKDLYYAIDTEEHNALFGGGNRIKCYTCTGSSPEFIATRSGCQESRITTFEKIFFDVRDKLTLTDYIASLAFPLVVPRNEDPVRRRERFFMACALMFGLPGLDVAMRRTVDISEQAMQVISQRLRSVTGLTALEFAIAEKTKSNFSSDSYQRHIDLLNVPQKDEQQSEQKVADFATNYARTIASKLQLSDDDKVINPLIQIGYEAAAIQYRLTHVVKEANVIEVSSVAPHLLNNSSGNPKSYTIEL